MTTKQERAEYMRLWRAVNRESWNAYKRKWRTANREKVNARKRELYRLAKEGK